MERKQLSAFFYTCIGLSARADRATTHAHHNEALEESYNGPQGHPEAIPKSSAPNFPCVFYLDTVPHAALTRLLTAPPQAYVRSGELLPKELSGRL